MVSTRCVLEKRSFFLIFSLILLGLMYLCLDDMLAIRTLVDTLRIPSLETRVRNTCITLSEELVNA